MDLLNQLQKNLPTGTFSYDSETIELPAYVLSEIFGRQYDIGGEAKDTFKAIAGAVLGSSGLLGIHLFILPADFIIPFAAQIIDVLMLAIAAMIRGFSTTARRARAIRV